MKFSLKEISIIQWFVIILGVFSALAIHVRFYLFDIQSGMLQLIDHIFYTHTITLLTFIICLSGFFARFSPFYIFFFVFFVWTLLINVRLLSKRSKKMTTRRARLFYIITRFIPLSLLIDEQRKRHRHIFINPKIKFILDKFGIYIKLFIGFLIFSYLYIGTYLAFYSVLAVIMISFFLLAIEFWGKSVEFQATVIEIISNNINFFTGIIVAIFLITSAVFGYARNINLRKSDSMYLKSDNFDGEVFYVGRISEGFIFREASDGEYFFISLSDRPIIRDSKITYP